MLEVYRRKVVYPLLVTLRGLDQKKVKLVVLRELLRFLLPNALYITYTAIGKMQLWYGTTGDVPVHLYTCPLVRLPAAMETGDGLIHQGDTWVAACAWGEYLFAATRAGLVVRTVQVRRGGDAQHWVHAGRSILEIQVAYEQLWVCTEEGVVLSYSRELHKLAVAYPHSRWYGVWSWTMAVGTVPYLGHRNALRVYSWNLDLDRGLSWELPPEVVNYARPRDGGVMSMKHCRTAMGKSLLVTALVDCYQIWDVHSVGGPGQLLRHYYLQHYVQCLAFDWDCQDHDPEHTGVMLFFQHWQNGYYIYSHKVHERQWGGIGVAECDHHFVVRDAGFQCFRHAGQWITISCGRVPPESRVQIQMNTSCGRGGWAAAQGRVANVIGFQGWVIDVHYEASRAVKSSSDGSATST